jgi:hypothetical protein
MKKIVLTMYLLLLISTVHAQFLDSLQLQIGTFVTAASKDYLPLWLNANRFGVVADRQLDLTTHLKATSSIRFGKAYNDIYDDIDRGVYLDYGVDIYNNSQFSKIIIPETYVNIRYRKIQFVAGRLKQIIGEVDHDLSSGSLGLSGNALPIPKLSFSFPEYTDLPFTDGFVQFKGRISHGWMGADQAMKHAFLHEKNLYMRLGKKRFKIYGGIQHYAVWGGENGDFKLDRSFKGLMNVFLVKEANDGSVPTEGSLRPNRAGDHRGVIEAGMEWENEKLRFNLNNQSPFDMGQGINIRNVDRLLSFNILNKNNDSWWNKITFEFIYTKQMNNFYNIHYRESYYNNGIYKTGWEYNDKIIGTPLFINRIRGSKYFVDVKPYDWDTEYSKIPALNNIVSNRVVGGHIGMIYKLEDQIIWKTLITYTRNYGNYMIVPYFNPEKVQWYSLNEFEWRLPNRQLALSASIGYDFGELTKNIGVMLGLKWQLRDQL